MLASVSIPLVKIYSSNEDIKMSESADRIAWMLDDMYDSDSDIMSIRGWDILPGPDCQLTANGHDVFLKNSKKEYFSYTINKVELSMGYGDEIQLKVTDGILIQL